MEDSQRRQCPKAPGAAIRRRVGLAFYLLALALAGAVVAGANLSAEAYQRLAALSEPASRTSLVWDDLLEGLTFGLMGDASRTAEQARAIEASAERYARWARAGALALGGAAALFLAVQAWLWRRAGLTPSRFIAHLFGVSGIFLLVGLTAPVLTLSAFQDVPMLGRVVLSHEVKSVLTLLGRLLESGDVFLGLLLLTFSVLVPVAKLVASLGALRLPPGPLRRRLLDIIHHVGRWSMADVFVVAVLLAFLATGGEGGTDAELGPGLYFFAAYALLSLAGGQMLLRWEPAGSTKERTT